ncbi:hypothetical protein VUR80DRAFT_3048 [Thermomyces stellatus]
MVEKVYVTYNDVHKLCQEAAPQILSTMQPTLMIAIGGGGYVPARILRSFLKREGGPNIPIQAIGLSLYESLPEITGSVEVEVPGTRVTRTQWLDMSALGQMENLVGKNILIVDEVDDTRTTLEYAVKELEKDIEAARVRMGGTEKTKFSIFVLHNKDKAKKGKIPEDMMTEGRYLAARTVGDVWICYPWEATDIDEHDRLAAEAAAKKNGNPAAA